MLTSSLLRTLVHNKDERGMVRISVRTFRDLADLLEKYEGAAGGLSAVSDSAKWIRGPELRKRWGDMPNSTFYNRMQRGLIPEPEYPFGPTTPYWSLAKIEQFEQREKLSRVDGTVVNLDKAI